MYAYLSKKIAIAKQQQNQQVNSLTWNAEFGWIALGGQQGLLKVLKLDDDKKPEPDGKKPTEKPAGGLSVNHTLENHSGSVSTVDWNEKYSKLTSSDSEGLIIVWMLHKAYWFEEMINNRNKSTVTDMKWSPDGNKICIVYLDGYVIVGSVDGARLWGKEYQHEISHICWSPDCRLILFGTPQGEVRIYDCNGNPLHQLKMVCLQRKVTANKLYCPDLPLAAIQWYNYAKMYTDDTPFGLCIAYQCGRIQLMKSDKDDMPTLIDTTMKITSIKWNNSGTIFAVSGSMLEQGEQRAIVQFYNNQGTHLRNLKVAGNEIVNAIGWEGTGLRIAMAVGPAIFFANIKMDHKWAWLSTQTLVFGYQKKDRVEFSVIFWDTKTDEKHIKFVKNLTEIMAYEDLSCIVTRFENEMGEFWQIDLCNSIGSPIDTKYINIEPICCMMTKTHIIICSQDHLYLWQYRNPTSKLTSFEAQTGLRKTGREIAWFIDDNPDSTQIYDYNSYDFEPQTEDIICAITANENFLFIGRLSGQINKYTLPNISLDNKLYVKQKPNMLCVNLNSTQIAVVDLNSTLTLLEVNADGGQLLNFEKKDVWNVKFAEDSPEQFVMMEKSRLYTVNQVTKKDPIQQDKTVTEFLVDEAVQTEAFICSFKELEVTGVFLDDFMKMGEGTKMKSQDLIVKFETQVLKQVKEVIKKEPIESNFNEIVKQFPHPCIYKYLAKKSLEDLDFISAEKAFLKLEDFQALQFLKRISSLDDKEKQRAWILVHYKQFQEAEDVFINIQRKDLAIDMRSKLGDWERVLKLAKEGTSHDDIILNAHKQLGQFYYEKYDWQNASHHYALAKDIDGQIEAYSQLEDYDALEKLISQIPDNSDHLLALGEKFQLIGLCDNAVKCFERAGEPKRALDCCVLLNHWNLATELADQYGFPQVEGLLTSYANQLLEKNQKLEAAELYRKANYNTEAAKLLSQIADDLCEKEANPLDIKKLYVMAALEVDLYKKRVLDQTMTGQNINTAKTLNSLITSTINTSSDKILQNPWRGAESWHFFLLCQRQLYNKQFRYALKTALRLLEYELDLEPKKIYNVFALAAYYNKSYKQLSRAFVKLEGLKDIQPHEKEIYEQMAVSIFTKHTPQDPPCEKFQCPGKNCQEQITEYDTHCKNCGANFSVCVASGRAILEKEFYSCKACRHKMIESEVKKNNMKFCALCHAPIDPKRFGQSDAN